jgi:nucleoside 2-deoxyribosyltransferase
MGACPQRHRTGIGVDVKIYIASSWKLSSFLFELADNLRSAGHEVDLFCESSGDRYVYVFDYREIENYQNMNGIAFMKQPRTIRAFQEDKKWIDWADAVVMMLPCGRSAHLEAGYAVGKGKKLYILGLFPKGDFDVMYGFADGLFRSCDDLLEALR